ncbi:MAG TPA: hypothetical protein VKH19_10790 [Gemmatimonadaceae bacterium]|nr:hypothetical protein [Gemmatimonadaceae bacterium]
MRVLCLAALVVTARVALAQSGPAKPEYSCAGLGVARTDQGELCVGIWTYMRYINQNSLHQSYTDAFGNTATIKRRQDIQNQKVTAFLRGWIFDPRLLFKVMIWTANTSIGDPNQLAVGGILTWVFSPRMALALGAGPLPTARSTQMTFPNWLKVDHRTIADEFFRGSYSTGVWVTGEALPGVKYDVMLANNLSGVGVDALELDNRLNTFSTGVLWMPTTHEFGPLEGYGDFEHHPRLATLVGMHWTSSREDRQSQPGAEDIDNTQLRLSDGTNIFTLKALPDGALVAASYRMLANDVGLKYRGYSLEASYYTRWLDRFAVSGTLPFTGFYDHGYEVQASAMLHPRILQLYVAGSQVLGQFGKPYDIGPGINAYPFRDRHLRFNGQALYASKSPVGYSAYPIPLGAKGWSFTFDTELFF